MIMEMLRTTEDRQSVQELLYLKAVASLNVDDLITAHYTVSELLEVRKGRILLLQAPKGLRTIRRLTLSLPPSPPPPPSPPSSSGPSTGSPWTTAECPPPRSKTSPRSTQALALKERINSEILRKGLTGIGILAGVVTIGATLAMKLARK